MMGTFNELYESAGKGEFFGYVCQWHLRRDGQLTIHALIVEPALQRQGIGSALLARLEAVEGATSLLAKCPADLPSNAWYARKGFTLRGREATPSGRELNVWAKPVNRPGSPTPKQLDILPLVEEPEPAYCLSDLDNHWGV